MKLLIKIVLVFVLLLVIGAVAGVMYIDGYAKGAVEESATKSFGVPTKLDSGDVKILTSEFTMSGINVDNPEGYAADHFLAIGDGGVSVTLASLLEDVVELPTVTFTGVDVYLQKNAGGSNYDIILGNLRKTDETDPDPESKKKFIIREVRIKSINVHADIVPLGKFDFPIDEIVLTDVGSGGDGVKLAEVSGIIMKTLFAAIASRSGVLPGEIVDELKNRLASLDLNEIGSVLVEDLEGHATEVLKGGDLDSIVDQATGDLEKAVDEGVGELLKGIGGSKEEDKPE